MSEEWKEVEITDNEIARWSKGNDNITIHEVKKWVVKMYINGLNVTQEFSDRAEAYKYAREYVNLQNYLFGGKK